MSYRVSGIVLLVAAAFALNACDKPQTVSAEGGSSGSATAVGVVDLDSVAKELGWMREMENNLKAVEQTFKNDLTEKQAAWGKQITDLQKQYAPKEGDKLTPQQIQNLQQMVAIGQQGMQQLQGVANQQFVNYRAEWVKRYREALEPIVRDVANDKHVKVVFTKTEQIMFVDNTVDITTAVASAARARPPVLAPVDKPELPKVGALPTPEAATQPATTAPSTSGTTTPKKP